MNLLIKNDIHKLCVKQEFKGNSRIIISLNSAVSDSY